MIRDQQKMMLLSKPNLLIKKKPFTRGILKRRSEKDAEVDINYHIDAELPSHPEKVISQQRYLDELDPYAHDVLFDDNVPSMCVKFEDSFYEIKFKKLALPYQRNILNKKILHAFGNKTKHSLLNKNATEKNLDNFSLGRKEWSIRNQDGIRDKFARSQGSCGDAGWLFYFDYKGRVKSRVISFKDGYAVCPHNDENGDRLLDVIYYNDETGENVYAYDDKYVYKYLRRIDDEEKDEMADDDGWIHFPKILHGFDESPLITKRGKVAWDDAEETIEIYEILYNIFNVIQRKFGNGILYINGNFQEADKKIAGNFILVDKNTNPDVKTDAKFLVPPSPEKMIETLDKLREEIQIASNTTWLLPKDVKMSGDISAIAIQLAQSLDYEEALRTCREYQNVANKSTRLFFDGLAKEKVNSGENPNAISEFKELIIDTSYQIWMPRSESDLIQMLNAAKGGGFLSQQTCVEENPKSSPSELQRIKAEKEEEMKIELKRVELTKQQEEEMIEVRQNGLENNNENK